MAVEEWNGYSLYFFSSHYPLYNNSAVDGIHSGKEGTAHYNINNQSMTSTQQYVLISIKGEALFKAIGV